MEVLCFLVPILRMADCQRCSSVRRLGVSLNIALRRISPPAQRANSVRQRGLLNWQVVTCLDDGRLAIASC